MNYFIKYVNDTHKNRTVADWLSTLACNAEGQLSEYHQWRTKLTVHKVPPHFRTVNPEAFKPQAFTFGPAFFSDQSYDQSHKYRALMVFLQRKVVKICDLEKLVSDLQQEVISSYDPSLLNAAFDYSKMLLLDGCFMLGILRACETESGTCKKSLNIDPIFGDDGLFHVLPTLRRDMLVLENQLPLVLLDRLLAVETGKANNEEDIHKFIMNVYGFGTPTFTGLGVHVLDVYRKRILNEVVRAPDAGSEITFAIPSATTLFECRNFFFRRSFFRRSRSRSRRLNQNDISYDGCGFSLPLLIVDNNTESKFLNLLAYEHLHPGAGSDVGSYVYFMSCFIHSGKDVALLQQKGVIINEMRNDEGVAKMFFNLSKFASISPDSYLQDVYKEYTLKYGTG